MKDGIRKVVGKDSASAKILYDVSSQGGLQKYKFRITSKKTAKVIDINVDFKKRIVEALSNVPNTLDPDPQTLEQEAITTQAENIQIGDPLPSINPNTYLGNLGLDVDADTPSDC